MHHLNYIVYYKEEMSMQRLKLQKELIRDIFRTDFHDNHHSYSTRSLLILAGTSFTADIPEGRI